MKRELSENLRQAHLKKQQPLVGWLNLFLVVMVFVAGFSLNSVLLRATGLCLFIGYLESNVFFRFAFFEKHQNKIRLLISALAAFDFGNQLPFQNTEFPVQGVLLVSTFYLVASLFLQIRILAKKFEVSLLQVYWPIWLVIVSAIVWYIDLYRQNLMLISVLVLNFFLLIVIARKVDSARKQLKISKQPQVEIAHPQNHNPEAEPPTVENFSQLQTITEDVEEKLLAIPLVVALHDFSVVQTGPETVALWGTLVVKNTTGQEQIFEIKEAAKVVLKESGFEETTLEIQYQIEFEQVSLASKSN